MLVLLSAVWRCYALLSRPTTPVTKLLKLLKLMLVVLFDAY